MVHVSKSGCFLHSYLRYPVVRLPICCHINIYAYFRYALKPLIRMLCSCLYSLFISFKSSCYAYPSFSPLHEAFRFISLHPRCATLEWATLAIQCWDRCKGNPQKTRNPKNPLHLLPSLLCRMLSPPLIEGLIFRWNYGFDVLMLTYFVVLIVM